MLVIVLELIFSLGGKKLTRTPLRKTLRAILFTMSALDYLSLFMNNFTHHAYSLTAVFDEGIQVYWQVRYHFYYYVHLGFCYFIILNIVYQLFSLSLNAPKIYRSKYRWLIAVVLLCVPCNAFFMFGHFNIDFSVCFYATAVCCYSYSILISLPKNLISNMMTVVSENLKSGVVCFDLYGKCIYINKLGRIIFKTRKNGFNSAEKYRLSFIQENLVHNNECEIEDILTINDVKHTFTVRYMEILDAFGKLQGSYLKFDDRTDEIQNLESEIYAGTHDSVTGLYNRKAFFENAAAEIRKNPDVPRYLVATDIENFKIINDLFGLEVGDKILASQGKMLSLANYPGTVHGRIAGDHFAMLIPKSGFKPEIAVMNTKRIQESVPELNYKLHLYIGIYEITDPEESVENMFDKANMAIRSIHGNYELTIAYYDKSLMDRQIYENSITSSFLSALEKEQFIPFLQPQYDSKTHKVLGGEALVRWNHEEFGLIEPKNFLNILEKSGSIYQMDKTVWRLAAERLYQWKQAGREDLYISVNISSKDFYYGDIYRDFSELVEEYQFKPENLKLEITESVFMYDLNLHKPVIEKLKKAGFKIEMDDFGSGYSSLLSLKNIAVDVLKIDVGFLKNSVYSNDSTSIVPLVIKMAKELDMQVIVEGVEAEDQVKFLAEAGCDIFQGFYFSKPVPLSLFEKQFVNAGGAL